MRYEMNNFCKKVKNHIFNDLRNAGVFNHMTDEAFIRMCWKRRFKTELNLENPTTFNEKIQWLKLYDRKSIYSTMVDKAAVKGYVAEKIGKEYIIPTLGIWERFDDIDFDALPNQFVLKCTHDSGGLVICRDKNNFDMKKARKKISKCLKRDYYMFSREWPYKDVKPRIIAEQYMEDSKTKELCDYKIFTFDGVAKALFIASDRQIEGNETKFDFFDTEFRHLPFTNRHPNADVLPSKPETFAEMMKLAEKLSQNIPHLRVDFYEVNGKAYFGELTFSHWGGLMPFEPEEWDKTFGDWIKLPEDIGGGILISDGFVLWIHKKEESFGLTDYKFYCFNGSPKFLYVSKGLENHSTARISFVTMDWQLAAYERADYLPFETLPSKPSQFDKMVELCKTLSKGHPFLRVDLYEIGSKIYFSELTFSPCGGFMPFKNSKHDEELGDMIKLLPRNRSSVL